MGNKESRSEEGGSIPWMKGIPTLVWVGRWWEGTKVCTGKD